jgi:acyl carrier protein
MNKEILSHVIELIAEQMGIDESNINENTNFIKDLGADSLDTVELVMTFEEAYGIEISDSEAELMETVGDTVNFIDKLKNKS